MKWLDNLGILVTKKVATMWCAIIFLVISLISLPAALQSNDAFVIISWISQSFLQLVLLPIIMVGQRYLSDQVEPLHEHHASHHKKLDQILDHVRGLHDRISKTETHVKQAEYRRLHEGINGKQ